MTHTQSILTLAFAALSISAHANTFQQTTEHLDLDGSLVAYVDFQGDGAEIGADLNAIYASALQSMPQMPPVPIDFIQIFDTMGFGSIRSMGLSSKQINDRLFANRYVTLLNGSPSGIFSFYGTSEDPLTPFTAANQAPADATGAMSGTINLAPLRESANAILQQIMGPMGEAMLQQQLQQLIPNTDITFNEVIDAFSGHIDAHWQQSFEPEMQQSFKAWAQFDHAGKLLARIRPIADSLQLSVNEDATGLTINASPLIEQQNMGLFLHSPSASDALIIYTHPNWTVEKVGKSLSDTEAFKDLATHLSKSAHTFTYSSGFDMEPMLQALSQAPQAAPFLSTARQAIDLLIGDFLKPNIAALTIKEDVILQEQYAGYSTKKVVMTLPAAITAGLGAAMAIPAFQKVRATSQQKAITNNLRQIASAAHQYFLENGATEVNVDQLVGEYIRTLDPIAGESYKGMIITTDMEEISVVLGDGSTVSIPF